MTPFAETLCWLILATCGRTEVAWANPCANSSTCIDVQESGWGTVHLRQRTVDAERDVTKHVVYVFPVFSPLDPIDRRDWDTVIEREASE